MPPPGLCGVPQYKLLDVDEFAFPVEKSNQTSVWALVCYRVHKDRHYKQGFKIAYLLAIICEHDIVV